MTYRYAEVLMGAGVVDKQMKAKRKNSTYRNNYDRREMHDLKKHTEVINWTCQGMKKWKFGIWALAPIVLIHRPEVANRSKLKTFKTGSNRGNRSKWRVKEKDQGVYSQCNWSLGLGFKKRQPNEKIEKCLLDRDLRRIKVSKDTIERAGSLTT
jgi:hypothetical protein